MKRFLIVVCLAGAMTGSQAVAAGAIPWFHERPKPVRLNDQPSTSPTDAQNRVPYHGTAVYPGSGRLYFEDAYDRRAQQEEPAKVRRTDEFARGRRFGAQRSQSNSAESNSARSK